MKLNASTEYLSGCCFSYLGILFVGIILIKVFQKYIWLLERSPVCLTGKTAIVTGANTGIGFFIAQDFAKRGAKVILACRDQTRAEIARQKVITATGNQNVHVALLDLSSFASIRKFVQHIKSTEVNLHILINNAGTLCPNEDVSVDDINITKQINYLGPFLLTILLLDLLKQSVPSRVVNSSSILCHFSTVGPHSLNSFNTKMRDYCESKTLTMLFTVELANKLMGSGVTVNAVNPGETITEITRNLPPFIRIPGKYFTWAFFKNAELGAQTQIYAAVSQDVEGVTGKYFCNGGEAQFPAMPKLTEKAELRKVVLEKSVELVKLTTDEIQRLNTLFTA